MEQFEFDEVEEFIIDHYEHFGFYPAEVETCSGEVYTYDQYLHFL